MLISLNSMMVRFIFNNFIDEMKTILSQFHDGTIHIEAETRASKDNEVSIP